MKQETLKITTGAMFIAIFAVFMLINRQTGGMFEGVVMYLLPIPMVAYSARFGFKAGLPVTVAMGLMAFFFGNLTSIIYAMTATVTGLIFGTCIYKKVEGTRTLFTVMLVSGLGEIVNLVLMAALMGLDIHREADEYREIFMEAVQKTATMTANPQGEQLLSMYDQLLTPDMMLRMLVISTVVAGLIQGFIIYKVSLMILNKLRFTIPKPVSIFTYTPPKWLSFLAIDLFVLYFFAGLVKNETIRSILQTLGLCAFLYLIFFGFLQVIYYFRVNRPGNRLLGFLLAFALLMIFSYALMVMGIHYVLNHKGEEAAEVLEKLTPKKKQSPYAYTPEPAPKPKNVGPRKGSMAYKANLGSMTEKQEGPAGLLPDTTGDEKAETKE